MAKVRAQTNLHGMVASSDWIMSGVLVRGLASFFVMARKHHVSGFVRLYTCLWEMYHYVVDKIY